MPIIEYLRQPRILDYAVFDIALAFVGIYLLSSILSKIFLKFGIIVSKKSWLLLTLPISIVAHLATGNMTLMTKNFFDPNGYFILKMIILVLVILGLKDVRFGKSLSV